MSDVLVPNLSSDKGMAFCLLASGPQGFISSFPPQSRRGQSRVASVRLRSTPNSLCPGGKGRQSCSQCQPWERCLKSLVGCSSVTLRAEFCLLTPSSLLTMGVQAMQTAGEGVRSCFTRNVCNMWAVAPLQHEQRAAFLAANDRPTSRFESAGISRKRGAGRIPHHPPTSSS